MTIPGLPFDPRPLQWTSHPPARVFAGPVVQAHSPCFVVGPFSLGGTDGTSMNHRAFTVPHWFPATLAAVGPLVWLYRRLRIRRRLQRNHCPSCAYDLRATPGRCPECGTTGPAGSLE